MKKGTLLFKNVKLHSNEIHKFRGYVGSVFRNHDLIHNHDLSSGKHIYRYPLIQFKMVKGKPAIVAFSDPAIQIFTEIFLKLKEVDIGSRSVPIHEKDFNLEEVNFGYLESKVGYQFLSPWIALNQSNFKKYIGMTDQKEKKAMLRRSFIGNVLSMAKGLGHWLKPDQRIVADLSLKQTSTNLKGNSFIGFIGTVSTNFDIPDYAAIGKSISRGYGVLVKNSV